MQKEGGGVRGNSMRAYFSLSVLLVNCRSAGFNSLRGCMQVENVVSSLISQAPCLSPGFPMPSAFETSVQTTPALVVEG